MRAKVGSVRGSLRLSLQNVRTFRTTDFPRSVYPKHESVTQSDALGKLVPPLFQSHQTNYKLPKVNALRTASVYIETRWMSRGAGESVKHDERTRHCPVGGKGDKDSKSIRTNPEGLQAEGRRWRKIILRFVIDRNSSKRWVHTRIL